MSTLSEEERVFTRFKRNLALYYDPDRSNAICTCIVIDIAETCHSFAEVEDLLAAYPVDPTIDLFRELVKRVKEKTKLECQLLSKQRVQVPYPSFLRSDHGSTSV